MADEHHHHDPTFYRTPRDAAEAPAEKLAYVATFSRPADQPDAIAVLDVDPDSDQYGSVVGFTELPQLGDELHHFGWNACSSALHPGGGHDHGGRRYLVVPGIRSSRIHILDTEPDPSSPTVTKVLEADEVGKLAGYSRPHTVHCGPGAVFVSCLGGFGEEGPAGSRCWTRTRSTCSGPGKPTAATSSSPTTCGGTSWPTWPSPPSGAPRP